MSNIRGVTFQTILTSLMLKEDCTRPARSLRPRYGASAKCAGSGNETIFHKYSNRGRRYWYMLHYDVECSTREKHQPFHGIRFQYSNTEFYPHCLDFMSWMRNKNSQFPALVLFAEVASIIIEVTFNTRNEHVYIESNPNISAPHRYWERFIVND